ncbi:Putative regulatory protein [Alloactinosynnema sp. L-07]|uniref:hypothetical protein n=1 Tax=Alloactinosynnema sp. L-07 TaxID=1653480 RepID=UPI00065EF504|nr:hypothetical protein [Alloactinosynnema sp. L-07]CRK61109.1 Putative regulatory protein [Alloactinosynnema sp. L-07]
MPKRATNHKPARTLLEQKIRERNETFEEFAESLERFGRDNHEVGTLSVRNLQRLVAGRRPDGGPLGAVRPATARLLERMFGTSIDELLRPPVVRSSYDDSAFELRQMLDTARRVDDSVIELLGLQLTLIRKLDRQLGAVVAHDEVTTKAAQLHRLQAYSTSPSVRGGLAALQSELFTLAGWQALDMGNTSESWTHYENGKLAAAECLDDSFLLHTSAEQAFVLLEIGKSADAVHLLAHLCEKATNTSGLLRSWLFAALGEALAANGRRSDSLLAFDRAAHLLPDSDFDHGPYVVLDSTHLARWRGHALARLGEPEAVEVLTDALERLDPSFTRAATGLRVDLATAFAARGEWDAARSHADAARDLAAGIGSVRQHRRMLALAVPTSATP